MTSKKSTTAAAGSSDAGTGMPDWMAPWRQMQQAAFDPLRWVNTAWLESALEANEELKEFLSRRIKEDIRTQHEILNCKNPAALQEIQTRFIRKALEDYAAETGVMIKMGQAFVKKMSRNGEDG